MIWRAIPIIYTVPLSLEAVAIVCLFNWSCYTYMFTLFKFGKAITLQQGNSLIHGKIKEMGQEIISVSLRKMLPLEIYIG